MLYSLLETRFAIQLMRYRGSSDLKHDESACTGVLLANIGTPEAPTPAAVRKYLAEFLGDPRVIELPRWLWMPILHGFILNTRPRVSAHAYQQIWTAEGSPLKLISQAQAAALQHSLRARYPGPIVVALGMRYGSPSIATAMEQLNRAGATRVLLLPLYPQYSGATTASSFDALADVLRTWRLVPELRTVMDYHNDALYIGALNASIASHWAMHGRADKLLFSFHGIPKSYSVAGDPYQRQCLTTARLVADALGLDPGQWLVSFQSRVGPREWLQPYTDAVIAELPAQRTRSLDVICPGFAADCLETLEEIAIRGRKTFIAAGGERFHYIPALNDSLEHIVALTELVLRHLQGWPETTADWNAERETAEGAASPETALRAGADR